MNMSKPPRQQMRLSKMKHHPIVRAQQPDREGPVEALLRQSFVKVLSDRCSVEYPGWISVAIGYCFIFTELLSRAGYAIVRSRMQIDPFSNPTI